MSRNGMVLVFECLIFRRSLYLKTGLVLQKYVLPLLNVSMGGGIAKLVGHPTTVLKVRGSNLGAY